MVKLTQAAGGVSREQILAIGRSSRTYEFLHLADRYLAAVPEDVEMRMEQVRGLARLGLGEMAAERAEQLPEELKAHADGATLIRQLRRCRSGRVAWGSLRRRFERNLAAWASRGGDAQIVAWAWETGQERLVLYRCVDGNYQVCHVDHQGRRAWLPGLLDHHRTVAATELPEVRPQSMPPPYLIEGVQLGGLVTRIWHSTRNTFLTYSPALYVVEPEAVSVAVALHLQDWSELLSDPRVLVFTGPDAGRRWAEIMVAQDDLRMPGRIVSLLRRGPALAPSLEELLAWITEERDRAAGEGYAGVRRCYNGRGPGYWADRFAAAAAGGGTVRVLLVTSRFTTFLQYSVRDIARAVERLGWSARVLKERDAFTTLSRGGLFEAVRDFQPDLVLLIDHLRYEYPKVFPPELPLVTWIQDMLPNLTQKRAGESVGPFDYVMGHGLAECVRSFGYPPEQFLPCQVPTNEHTFGGRPCTDQELAPYRCDVAYVGTGSAGPRQVHEDFLRLHSLDEACRRVLEHAYEMLAGLMDVTPGRRHQQLGRVLREAAAAAGVELSAESSAQLETTYVSVVADRMYRFQTLEWVADWAEQSGRTFHLYGCGWEGHPRLAGYARGPIENGEPLRRLYQAAKINLHCNLHGAVHQRLLDGLCAGGFFLVRYNVADFMYEPLRLRLEWMRRVRDRIPNVFRLGEHPALVASFDAYPAAFELDAYPLTFEVTEEGFQATMLNERVAGRSVASGVFPEFEAVTFKNREEFFEKAEHFVADRQAAGQITNRLRERVRSLYTYEGLMRELVAAMAVHFRRLAENGSASAPVPG